MLNKNAVLRPTQIIIALIFLAAFSLSFITISNHAKAITCPDGSFLPDAEAANCPDAEGNPPPPPSSAVDDQITTDCEPPEGERLSKKNCGIINLLVIGINFLSAVAGIAIVFAFMFAGYLYMTARDNAGQVQKAKQRIVWAIVALALFIFMYALLDFLVPGGVI